MTVELSVARKKKIPYFDRELGRCLDEGDACSLEEWATGTSGKRYARHSVGFAVFLRPEQIASSDEYAEGDPYAAAEGLEKWPAFQSRRHDVTLKLLERLIGTGHPSRAILDIACGEGVITAKIAQRFSEATVCGIDYSMSAIERAARHHPGIDFVVGDAYELPYQEGCFDVVVLNNIWEHVPDPLRLLGEATRVLKTGGAVIISTPSRYRLRNMVRVCLGLPVVFMSKHHVTEYSVGQVLEQLRFAGMSAEVIDEPLRGPAGGTVRFVAFKIVVPLIRFWARMLRSHHSPEETVFYLARKS